MFESENEIPRGRGYTLTSATKARVNESTSLLNVRTASLKEDVSETSSRLTEASSQLYLELPVWAMVIVPLLLLVSAILNVIALLSATPFLTINIEETVHFGPLVLHPKVPGFESGGYGMWRTLELLKQHELWALYVFIFCFSVVWPPLKILIAAALLATPLQPPTRRRALAVLGQLGRLSLVDVYFCVLVVVVVANQSHQIMLIDLALSATIEWGVLVFHAAVFCSIASVAILEDVDAPRAPTPARPPGAPVRVLGTAAALAAIVLVPLSFFLPLFTIEGLPAVEAQVEGELHVHADILLNHTWSLSQGTFDVLMQSASGPEVFFGLDVLVFTLVTPLLCTCTLLVVHTVEGAVVRAQMRRVARILSQFSNLEILLVAMLVYLTQEDNIVRIDLDPAFWCLVAYASVLLLAMLMAKAF